MKSKIFVSIIFILIISLAAVFFSGCVERTQDIEPDVITDDSQAVEADTTIYIDDYEFHPYLATISAGDTVMWVNNDSVAFIIKGNLVGGDSFQSPTLRKDDTFTYTFEDVGTYKYELVTHPWTKGGQIVVE